MWRSFDDLTPCPKKRTPQQILADEISQNLEGLDLEGLPQNSSGKKKVGLIWIECVYIDVGMFWRPAVAKRFRGSLGGGWQER